MKIIKLSIFFAALLLIGSCSKEVPEKKVPFLSGYLQKYETFPTSVLLSYLINPDTKVLEKGVMMGEDSTKLSITVYDRDTTVHDKINLLVKCLMPEKTYYFKSFVRTSTGVISGSRCYKIATTNAGAPAIRMGKPISFNSNYDATIFCAVLSDGGAPIEEAGLIVGDKTYKIANSELQLDTLKCILKDLNVNVRYKFYARNSYGTTTFEGGAGADDMQAPFCKYFTVNATSEEIDASCVFFGHGLSNFIFDALIISDKPITVPSVDTDNSYGGGGKYSGTSPSIYIHYGTTEWSDTYYGNESYYKPNTTYYVRMRVQWYTRVSDNWVTHYYWTEEKTVVTPSVIVLNNPTGSSSEQKLIRKIR
jgi:hypothetical protein